MQRRFLLIAAVALVLSCGPRPKKSQPSAKRDFPAAEIPVMLEQPQERVGWLTEHFWDRFTDPSKVWESEDSTLVNGVEKEALERQMGVFVTLLEEVSLPQGQRSMEAFFNRLETFQQAHPKSNMLKETSALVTHYLYDPNSPVRSEDLYLPFVRRMATSSLIDAGMRTAYAWDTSMCEKNQTGTPAANFTFIDTKGVKRTLYGIKATYTLLIFGNPDCTACKEIMEQMDGIPEIDALIDSGKLKVADIYIDQEIEDWKKRAGSYPTRWINGYDPSYIIRGELLYSLRAIPSLYLLDRDKNVLLKDAPAEKVLNYLLTH